MVNLHPQMVLRPQLDGYRFFGNTLLWFIFNNERLLPHLLSAAEDGSNSSPRLRIQDVTTSERSLYLMMLILGW